MAKRPRPHKPKAKARPEAKSRPKRTGKPTATPAGAPWHRGPAPLVLIVLVAGILRLVWLGYSPPGLNQDEAANAWNAYCLLKTGQDQAGVRWPIFYSRCLGANRSTLYLYILMPFQAIGGLNVWTTRAPSAIGGVLTVLLTYVVGSRLFGRNVGLVAAALLAVNPWHLQQSRWGHEGALCTFLVMTPLAALLWANLPFDDAGRDKRRCRIWAAGLAGALTGICCYGYPAVRVFLPVFLTTAVLVTWRGWWDRLRTRNGALAIGALAVAVSVTFGPLAWQHLTDTNHTGISKRSVATWVWRPDDPVGAKIGAALARYPGHFGPDFLFINGDHYNIQSVPGFGQFHWYMAPLMVLGLIVVLRRAVVSRAARVLLIWLPLYPVSDCLTQHISAQHVSMHALRASPGMCVLILLAAVGLVDAAAWFWRRQRGPALAAGALAAVVAVALNVRFLHYFFGDYNRLEETYYLGWHVDLLEACEWLRPRLDDVDAVFCTTQGMNLPHIVALVGLSYDPHEWFRGPRDVRTIGQWDRYVRYGKMTFMYGGPLARLCSQRLNELKTNGRADRVLFIVRPGKTPSQRLLHQVTGLGGLVSLCIYEATI